MSHIAFELSVQFNRFTHKQTSRHQLNMDAFDNLQTKKALLKIYNHHVLNLHIISHVTRFESQYNILQIMRTDGEEGIC